jgi:iron complex outermembrane receptor protein
MKERWRVWRRILALTVGTGLVMTGLPAAYGQDAEETASEESEFVIEEEIVVTAERRAEDINDVPLTITAFDSRLIEELGIVDEQDIEALTPGLQFGYSEEQTGQGTVIRGIGTRVAGANHMDMGVATYVDGVYSRTTTGVAPNLFDVERVEVARGPQGTLNGKNSIAGSINFVTKRPSREWDAQVLGEFTDQATQRYNMAFGGPLIGPLMFRLTGGVYTGDGAQKNIGLGGDYDQPDEASYSPQLRFQWNRFDVNVRYARTEDTGVPRTNLSLFDPPRDQPWICDGAANFAADAFNNITESTLTGTINGVPYTCEGTFDEPENIWYGYMEPAPAVEDCGGVIANLCDELKNEVNLNRPGIKDVTREAWTVNVDIEIIDGLVLQYTYGDNTTDQYGSRDLDLTNQTGPSVPNGVYDDRRNISPFFMEDASHEVQLLSNFDRKFNFILGYYEHEGTNLWAVSADGFSHEWRTSDTYDTCVSDFAGSWADFEGTEFSCATGSDHTQMWYFGTESASETQAYFAHGSYDYSDVWSFSGGLRQTKDTKYRTVQFIWWSKFETYFGANPVVAHYATSEKPTQTLGAETRPSWSDLIWNVGVEYKPTDTRMIYGRISTGYRAGGFNDSSGYNPEIKKETLINYELGVKGLFLGQRLNVRAAGFFQDYQDYQNVASMDPGLPICGGGITGPCLQPTASSPILEFTTNIPDTKIWGLEVEGHYYVTPKLKVGGFYTYLGSDLGTFEATTFADPNPTVLRWDYIDEETGQQTSGPYQAPREWTGGRLPQQPAHKGAITVLYENSFDGVPGTFHWSGWLNYTGERYPYAQNLDSQVMRAYNRLDLRAGWTSPNGKLSATGFIQNVMNEIGLVAYLPQNGGANTLYPPLGTLSDPRRVGAVVSWRM